MIRFTKMEGLGNDYIYLNNIEEGVPEDRLSDLAVAVSDRHFGVGADGLIVILAPTEPGYDLRFRMFNADGSEGEMCGNGMRCFARYCYDRNLVRKTKFAVQTLAGTITPEVLLNADGSVDAVRVDMGAPRLKRREIPMVGPAEEQVLNEPLEVDGQQYEVTAVSMGNPHLVTYMDDVEAVDLTTLGPKVERHAAFPQRINFHVVEVIGPAELKMRTWERGSGITLACATGASAVLAASHLLGRTGRQAVVHLPGGDLKLDWDEASGHIFQTGPANYVCDGVFTRPLS